MSWYVIRDFFAYSAQVNIPLQICGESAKCYSSPAVCTVLLLGTRFALYSYLRTKPSLVLNSDAFVGDVKEVIITSEDLHLPEHIQLLHYSAVSLIKLV